MTSFGRTGSIATDSHVECWPGLIPFQTTLHCVFPLAHEPGWQGTPGIHSAGLTIVETNPLPIPTLLQRALS